MNRYFYFNLLFSSILLSLFCSCEKETPVPSPNVTTIFHEDFHDNSKSWHQQNNDTALVSVASDSYIIFNKGIYSAWNEWSNIQLDTNSNWSIKSSLSWKSGVTNYGYGLLWGVKGVNNQNYFIVSPNGAYTIGYYKNGNSVIIKNWTFFYAINPSNNLLEVKKEGTKVSFIINNKTAYSTTNLRFYDNGIGFVVVNNMKVSVDYLDVTQW